MRILVTGGAGYIGSQVVLRLCELGHDVTTLDNLSSGNLETLPGGNFVEGDVCDLSVVGESMKKFRTEAVFHLAAVSDLRDSIENPLKYYRNNVTGTQNVIHACVNAGVRHVVFSSSASVYGVPENTLVSETDPLQPVSPYGWTKLMGEQILKDCASASDFNYIALRFFNVAGADLDNRCGESAPEAWHLIKIACQAATGGRKDVTINGRDYATEDGTCIRDYVHVDDIALAHIKSLEYLIAGGRSDVFNVGYGQGASVKQILDLVLKHADHKFPVLNGVARAGDPPRLVARVDKIQEILGWTPRHDDLDTIVCTALAWEKKLAVRPH